jgi:iron complex transport system ATP-binding protein
MNQATEPAALEGENGRLLLRTDRVSFGYSHRALVINRISFSLEQPGLAALIGANGSGKTTLVRLLAGLLTPTEGSVYFEGRLLSSIPRQEVARQMAYVPQTNAMIFPFSGLEVVLTGRTPHTSRFQFENQADREKALAALETVGAQHLAFRPVTQLSGGERQLIALARALAQEPKCLMLDEPSSSLDLKHRAGLIRTLRDLHNQKGLSAIVVTHDLQLLDPVFERVFALKAGELVAEGRPSEILQDDLLARIYDDPYIRSRKFNQRTFIWSET